MSDLKGNIAYLLTSLLIGVAMVTLTVTVVHIMQGDRESVKKFIRWVLVASIGVCLLEVVGHPNPAGSELCGEIRKVITALGGILKVLMLIGASGSLVIVVVKMLKGERESAEHLLYWLVGFAVGVVILSALLKVYGG